MSCKLSYFTIYDYISIEELSYNNESTLIITPVFVYNLNLTKDKKIKFCSQVGFSAMLSPLKAEINYENGGSFRLFGTTKRIHTNAFLFFIPFVLMGRINLYVQG